MSSSTLDPWYDGTSLDGATVAPSFTVLDPPIDYSTQPDFDFSQTDFDFSPRANRFQAPFSNPTDFIQHLASQVRLSKPPIRNGQMC